MSATAPAIEFDGAAFAYRERDVLCDVRMWVREREFVGVLGPNGSGKTTLVRGATRVVTPRAGTVRIHGDDVAHITRRELARRVAVVPQEGVPIFPYTVLETVLMGRAPWLGSFAFEGDEDVARARATRWPPSTRRISKTEISRNSPVASANAWSSRARSRRTRAS